MSYKQYIICKTSTYTNKSNAPVGILWHHNYFRAVLLLLLFKFIFFQANSLEFIPSCSEVAVICSGAVTPDKVRTMSVLAERRAVMKTPCSVIVYTHIKDPIYTVLRFEIWFNLCRLMQNRGTGIVERVWNDTQVTVFIAVGLDDGRAR